MSDTFIALFALLLLFIVLPMLILLIRDRARRHADAPMAAAAERLAFEGRLLHPDWVLAERQLQRPLPPGVRELYVDRNVITRRDVRCGEHVIDTFEPLDDQAVRDASEWLGFAVLPLATTDLGDTVYLRPGPTEPDVVYLTHHDGGDTEVFAESVAAILRTIKRRSPR